MKLQITLLILLALLPPLIVADSSDGGEDHPRNLRWWKRRRNRRGRGGGGGGGWRGGGGGHGGGGGGRGFRGGQGALTSSTATDPRDTIRTLRWNRDKIFREVDYDYHDKDNKGGVKSITGAKDSGDTEVNNWIMQHVNEMIQLANSGGTIRTWDGLFREIFDNLDKLHLECDYEDEKGTPVVCTHTGNDCYAEALAKAHGKTVSRFISRSSEVDNDHEYLIDRYYDSKCDDD